MVEQLAWFAKEVMPAFVSRALDAHHHGGGGSYPQPRWLVDHDRLRTNAVPRVRMPEMWRIAEPFLEAAQDDAVRLAVADMEAADVDIVTDGEQRRESLLQPVRHRAGRGGSRHPRHRHQSRGQAAGVTRIVGPVARARAVLVNDARFLRGITRRRIKVTIPGPFTMTQLAQDEETLPRSGAPGHGLCRGGQRRARLSPNHRGRAPARRAVHAGPAGPGARLRGAGHRPGAAGLRKTTVVHLCFGYAFAVEDEAQRVLVPARARPLRRGSDLHRGRAAGAPALRASRHSRPRPWFLGVLDLGSPQAETRRTRYGGSRPRSRISLPRGWWSRPTAA